MILDRVQWKFPITNGEKINPDDFFRQFSDWIPGSPEVYIDVVDYKHVHAGQKILLAGYYSDVAFDHGDCEWGLLFSQKRPVDGDDLSVLQNTFSRALLCLKKISPEIFSVKPEFDSQKIHMIVNDRAAAPNTKATWEKISPALENLFSKKVDGKLNLKHVSDSARRFEVIIHFDKPQNFVNWNE